MTTEKKQDGLLGRVRRSGVLRKLVAASGFIGVAAPVAYVAHENGQEEAIQRKRNEVEFRHWRHLQEQKEQEGQKQQVERNEGPIHRGRG
jgi:hypothetical protein